MKNTEQEVRAGRAGYREKRSGSCEEKRRGIRRKRLAAYGSILAAALLAGAVIIAVSFHQKPGGKGGAPEASEVKEAQTAREPIRVSQGEFSAVIEGADEDDAILAEEVIEAVRKQYGDTVTVKSITPQTDGSCLVDAGKGGEAVRFRYESDSKELTEEKAE